MKRRTRETKESPMTEKNLDAIFDDIFSDTELQKVYSMREENTSESFDPSRAIETARKSNFGEAMREISTEGLL